MPTPNYSLLDLPVNSVNPQDIINNNNVIIEALLTPIAQSIVGITAPPGDPSNGSLYVPASGATGVWAGHDFELCYYLNSWYFIEPLPGQLLESAADQEYYKWDGNAWLKLSRTIFTHVTNLAANTVASTENNNTHIYYNSASNYTFTLPQTTTESINAGYSLKISRLGTGTVTIAVQGSDTLLSIGSLTQIAQYGTAEITKLVNDTNNTWLLTGDLV